MVNYIEDTNRFHLPTPPEWFLKQLFDYDALLVLVPSRIKVKGEKPAYLLCRRRQHSAGLGDVAMLDNKHPDTNMCYAHGIVPIAPLRFNNGATGFTQQGCTSLINELKSRDNWAISGGPTGNADAIWQQVEANEAAEERKARMGMRDTFYHMARDAYRSLKARTGQRNKRASDYHGVARQPQREQRVILTDAQ